MFDRYNHDRSNFESNKLTAILSDAFSTLTALVNLCANRCWFCVSHNAFRILRHNQIYMIEANAFRGLASLTDLCDFRYLRTIPLLTMYKIHQRIE